MSDDEADPCPFRGCASANTKVAFTVGGGGMKGHRVLCHACGANGPASFGDGGLFYPTDTYTEAIRLWNDAPRDDAPRPATRGT